MAQPEKDEQAAIKALIETIGGWVYVLGTRRSAGAKCQTCGTFVAEHQGTRQTAGICDLIAFLPWTAANGDDNETEGLLDKLQKFANDLAVLNARVTDVEMHEAYTFVERDLAQIMQDAGAWGEIGQATVRDGVDAASKAAAGVGYFPRKATTNAGALLMIEVKANGGRLSNEQKLFAALCAWADVSYITGGIDAVIAWLTARKYINVEAQS